ncbi:MAG: FAD-dependent oxidoreductase [Anaerolineae bacterium]|nr:FAD-dependent oxidoreductase [Anaerolineae bacterium]
MVNRIEQYTAHVEVFTHGGQRYTTPHVIVATPLNTWHQIDFRPALPPAKLRLSQARHAGAGLKCFVQVRGHYPGLLALAAAPDLFSLLTTGHLEGDTTWLIGFSAARPQALTPEWAQKALAPLLPEAEVLAIVGHHWAVDPLALGTWANFKPGQVMHLEALRAPAGRVSFASADIATAWRGYIDGAIESGLRAAAWLRSQTTG